jgi:hypothetical protein
MGPKSVTSSHRYSEKLIQAAADDDLQKVDILLSGGVDVNCCDYDHRSDFDSKALQNLQLLLVAQLTQTPD